MIEIPTLTESDIKRFWSKVDKRGPNDCWEWVAALDTTGRGVFRVQKVLFKAPRISYTLSHKDPEKLCVCHSCDNPACCNPKHLWLGTQTENTRDRDIKGRQVSRRGNNHGCAVLTEEQARYILNLLRKGES
jgi:hypothetical protein